MYKLFYEKQRGLERWILRDNADWIVSWLHESGDSIVEIQKNEDNLWEAEFFQCNKCGFVEEQAILIQSDVKENTIEFSIDWMNHHDDGLW